MKKRGIEKYGARISAMPVSLFIPCYWSYKTSLFKICIGKMRIPNYMEKARGLHHRAFQRTDSARQPDR